MTRLGAAALFFVLAPSTLGGCYLSHDARGDAGRPIDARSDAPRLDVPLPDVPVPDVPLPTSCERLAISATAALDGEARGAVTPRITALPDGGVAVVYVRSDGDPTRVIYERRDRSLLPVVAPTTVGRDGFTWAEIALVGDRVFIPYGAGGGSVIDELLLDGTGVGRASVPMEHPSLFYPTSSGFFWASFDSRGSNSLVMSTVEPGGGLLYETVRIELGRYGSGHHAVVAPDPRRVILGYPREGPPGARHGYLNAIDERGALGPERQLFEGDITSVTPFDFRGELWTVWEGDALGIEHDDWNTLEMLEQYIGPSIEGPFIAGAVEDHIIIARFSSGLLEVDVYDDAFRRTQMLEAPIPTPTFGSGTSIATMPGAAVITIGLTSGSDTFPWLARIECAE